MLEKIKNCSEISFSIEKAHDMTHIKSDMTMAMILFESFASTFFSLANLL
jgi:hypothetical protein